MDLWAEVFCLSWPKCRVDRMRQADVEVCLLFQDSRRVTVKQEDVAQCLQAISWERCGETTVREHFTVKSWHFIKEGAMINLGWEDKRLCWDRCVKLLSQNKSQEMNKKGGRTIPRTGKRNTIKRKWQSLGRIPLRNIKTVYNAERQWYLQTLKLTIPWSS